MLLFKLTNNFNIGRFEWSLLYVRINVRWNWRKDEKNQSAPQEIYDSQRCSWWRFNPRDKRKRKYSEPGLEWGIHNVSRVVLSREVTLLDLGLATFQNPWTKLMSICFVFRISKSSSSSLSCNSLIYIEASYMAVCSWIFHDRGDRNLDKDGSSPN